MSFYYKPCSLFLRNDDWLHPLLFWLRKRSCQSKKKATETTPRISEVSRYQSLLKWREATWHPRAHTISGVAVLFSYCSSKRWHLCAKTSPSCLLYPPCSPNSQLLVFFLAIFVWSPVIITDCCFRMQDKLSFSRSFSAALHHRRAASVLQETTAGRNPTGLDRPSPWQSLCHSIASPPARINSKVQHSSQCAFLQESNANLIFCLTTTTEA